MNMQAATLSPLDLRVEYSAGNLLGIDSVAPRLSWKSTAEARAARQSAYQIQAAASAADLAAEKLLWDSGKLASDQSLFVPYGGPDLKSGERLAWRVRVWDQDGDASAWSEPASWEMGLLAPADWQAQWITAPGPVDTAEDRPVAMFRHPFTTDGEVVRARLYASARGLYALELNGQPVGNQLLTPGWTSYHHRIQYQTYDVTDLLKSGANALGAELADGWYRGYLTWEEGKRNVYGERTALIVQLHLTYRDGREVIIGSDESWQVSTDGPYRKADIYDGETYDARREMTAWSTADFDASAWQKAEIYPGEPVALVAPEGPPVRRMEEIEPVAITQAPNGATLVDMGQNMVGWVRLRLNGPAGTTVTLRHAEVLDPEGNLYTDNLRSADQTDRYTLAGEGEEVFEPLFTFHGFRYVEIRGYPGALKPEAITGVVVYSDMARTGSWSSSDTQLNQLYHNIVWGQKGNFVDVPTDCPQRDERLGWTGDAQVFAPTAAFNMDVSGFFAKWLADLALDQLDSGSVPYVSPNVLDDNSHGTAGWGDAATVIPWAMHRAYGDKDILAAQFASMVGWVDYLTSQAGEDHIWRPDFQFGDWLAPALEESFGTFRANTGVDLIATAYYAHSAVLVARAARVIGREDDASRYQQLFEDVRDAFQREFVTGGGRIVYETQTAYVLALDFELLPAAGREAAAARLAADVRAHGSHLTTGFLGTPEITRVLSDYGQTETAYRLLNQTSYPSWLYPIQFGATTIWERWDAVRTDGTFQNPSMTSFNHYAYGAVGRWMVEVVAGLEAAPDGPGYKRVLFRPQPGGGLRHAQASLDTPYGNVASAWAINGPEFSLATTVAPNTTALVVLPMAAELAVTENGVAIQHAAGVKSVTSVGADLHLEIGSGNYRFVYQSPELALQAANFRDLGPKSTLGELLAAPGGRELLAEKAPKVLDPSLPQEMIQGAPLSAIAQLASPAAYEALLNALSGINATRRAAILATDDAASTPH